MAVPRLALDRPFTYLVGEEHQAGIGSLVSVRFHGRNVKGWILGPAQETPSARLLPITKVQSPVRFFDRRLLELFRWMSSRYLASLAAVIERSHPPRVVGEEKGLTAGGGSGARFAPEFAPDPPVAVPPTWLRPLPGKEAESCLTAVGECLGAGRQAIVLVPEADPVPHTAAAVLEAFGDRAVAFLGGEARVRYRTWLALLSGRFDVVVATRTGVFAPLPRVGLLWISREVHPGHREERAPYYHVREVAVARARIHRADCVVASLSPSIEVAAEVDRGAMRVSRPPRAVERAAAPLVEVTAPEAEDRSPRLAALLKGARSGALIVSRRGYGVARVCRACGEPAACARCRGPIVVERGRPACRVCGGPGVCANCGGESFGIERRGTERVAEWASRAGSVPASLDDGEEGESNPPGPGRLVVGTAAAVKDVGDVRVDLVAILDPDRALARPGLSAGPQALATWMEAAAWAGPRGDGGRVLVQTRRPGHPAVQALVRWEPLPYLLGEASRRAEAGFPPGHPTYRITGGVSLPDGLRSAGASTVLTTAGEKGTLCLVAVPPDRLDGFRREVLRLVADGVVERVEAEPQL